jgi:hypothetical protein
MDKAKKAATRKLRKAAIRHQNNSSKKNLTFAEALRNVQQPRED